jgi:hypothetical protein
VITCGLIYVQNIGQTIAFNTGGNIGHARDIIMTGFTKDRGHRGMIIFNKDHIRIEIVIVFLDTVKEEIVIGIYMRQFAPPSTTSVQLLGHQILP